ncbi:MAG TPA: 30S ribosomal protein S17 [Candidatus Paceibacterota bacterium]|jgi:small subunit ribosomal protein S17
MATEPQNSEGEGITKGKELAGVVVSDKMQDTVVVKVTRYVKHSKYQKYIKRDKRYKAHDKGNAKSIGDRVVIRETKPISKDKRFIVV